MVSLSINGDRIIFLHKSKGCSVPNTIGESALADVLISISYFLAADTVMTLRHVFLIRTHALICLIPDSTTFSNTDLVKRGNIFCKGQSEERKDSPNTTAGREDVG
jgi:hypothetical protein